MHPKYVDGMANSVDPDQKEQSDLDQHSSPWPACLKT